ncbi:MAG: hypothetical protein IJ341_00425 [Bacteroidales bacterium]|nr:hypothetical protein [Bacteroidales bacterium]MBQ7818141.1 hypothetical protein [Bacteroidales bacterium]
MEEKESRDKTKDVIITIPIYTLNFSEYEWASIKQCFKVLRNYSICYIKPESLDISTLNNKYKADYIESFPDIYFKGISGYNRLMLSPIFYNRFKGWKYIFIYQTDAWVFNDNLQFWCDKDYDYIGAPWIPKKKYSMPYYKLYVVLKSIYCKIFSQPNYNKLYYNVGNGGISLRKTDKFAIESQKRADEIENLLSRKAKDFYNEDVYWSITINEKGKILNIPQWQEALNFSFDKNPEESLQMNNGNLPFCCHGWTKQKMLPFWQKYIMI